jgi:hypothetical protein
MGKKQKSNLPADFFTDTGGSNYGLDGYHFDHEYDEGVYDQARLPEVAGLGGLPDGIVVAEQEALEVESSRYSDAYFDLTGMVKEGALANLGWLDFTSQDPDRLPKQPVDRMVQELTQAWGTNQRTDGLRLLPNTDKEILDYEESMVEEGQKKRASQDNLLRVARRAMRRAMSGVPLEEITKEAYGEIESLEGDVDQEFLKKSFRLLYEDKGLAGNVFVRASAFPNCHNGKWTKTVRKHASSAKYVVAKKECESCILLQSGRCASFKKEVVNKVPWSDALDHYRDILRAQGHKVASTGNPRDVLKNAFLSEVEQVVATSHKPIEVPVSDKISLKDARKEFQAASLPEREVLRSDDRDKDIYRNRILSQIQKWGKSGLISKKDTKRLLHSTAESKKIMDTAMSLVAETRKPREYAGTVFEKFAHISSDQAWRNLQAAESKASSEKARIKQELSKRTKDRLVDMRNAGLITKNECKKLIRYANDHTPEQSLELALALVAKKSAHTVKIPKAKEARVYEGVGNEWIRELRDASDHENALEQIAIREAAQMEDSLQRLVSSGMISQKEAKKLTSLGKDIKETMKLASALIADRQMKPVPIKRGKEAKVYEAQGPIGDHVQLRTNDESSVNPKAVVGVLKWSARQMNEGVLGNELDQMLHARFSKPMLKAASAPLQKLRKRHEGAAGHLYVDASAYASKTGSTGCEEGALQHRANGIKLVLGMKRCASCVFNNADGVCQKYNKTLIDNIPKEAKGYKEEMKRLADGTDAERTASLFAPADHSVYEYGVSNDTLNDFSFDIAASNESLGEVLFGGLELGDGD